MRYYYELGHDVFEHQPRVGHDQEVDCYYELIKSWVIIKT